MDSRPDQAKHAEGTGMQAETGIEAGECIPVPMTERHFEQRWVCGRLKLLSKLAQTNLLRSHSVKLVESPNRLGKNSVHLLDGLFR